MYYIGAEEQQAVLKVLEKGDLCRYGPEDSTVSNFECGVEEKFNTKHALATNGGTSSLIVGLYAAGIGLGDEVITVPYTFISTVGSIVTAGAQPVFVDIKEDYNIDEEKFRKKRETDRITKKYRNPKQQELFKNVI